MPVTDEATQAAIYGDARARQPPCDPDVAEVNFFGFYDDGPRDTGFQAALHRADGTPRAAGRRRSRAAILAGRRPAAPVGGSWRRPGASSLHRSPIVTVVGDGRSASPCSRWGSERRPCVLPGRLLPAAACAGDERRALLVSRAVRGPCNGLTSPAPRPLRSEAPCRPSDPRPWRPVSSPRSNAVPSRLRPASFPGG